jgi:hypothetical protein
MIFKTILWLDRQIDEINGQSKLIGDLLLDENDPNIIEKYDKKLAELERQLEVIDQRIELERKMLDKLKEN